MNESRCVKRGDPTAVKTLSFTSHHREDWRGCVFLICDIHAAFPSLALRNTLSDSLINELHQTISSIQSCIQ